MTSNLYEAPKCGSPSSEESNFGHIGFYLSLTAVISLFACLPLGPIPILGTVVFCLPFLGLPGVITSTFAMFRSSSKEAKRGFWLGLFACMYLPTWLLTLIHAFR